MGEELETIEAAAAQTMALVGEWDASRLTRVVDNLLGNATKYSPNGGPVAVTLARTGGDGVHAPAAVLSVRDQGVGIPAAEVGRVTEPFSRASNAVGRIRGTGIGLAGARQIVEQHGGSLTIASEEGAGTTVTVMLPLG